MWKGKRKERKRCGDRAYKYRSLGLERVRHVCYRGAGCARYLGAYGRDIKLLMISVAHRGGRTGKKKVPSNGMGRGTERQALRNLKREMQAESLQNKVVWP